MPAHAYLLRLRRHEPVDRLPADPGLAAAAAGGPDLGDPAGPAGHDRVLAIILLGEAPSPGQTRRRPPGRGRPRARDRHDRPRPRRPARRSAADGLTPAVATGDRVSPTGRRGRRDGRRRSRCDPAGPPRAIVAGGSFGWPVYQPICSWLPPVDDRGGHGPRPSFATLPALVTTRRRRERLRSRATPGPVARRGRGSRRAGRTRSIDRAGMRGDGTSSRRASRRPRACASGRRGGRAAIADVGEVLVVHVDRRDRVDRSRRYDDARLTGTGTIRTSASATSCAAWRCRRSATLPPG